MQLTFVNILAIVFTYLAFGYLGFRWSKRFKRPISLAVWLVAVLAAIGSIAIAPGAILLGVGEFIIHFNEALQAIGLGIIVGLATREIRLRFTTHGTSNAAPSGR
jgi:hypothetical protein